MERQYGWIKPDASVDHPLAGKHKGRLYIHTQDIPYTDSLPVGQRCQFYVFIDASGLGAEECCAEDNEEDWENWGDLDDWDAWDGTEGEQIQE